MENILVNICFRRMRYKLLQYTLENEYEFDLNGISEIYLGRYVW